MKSDFTIDCLVQVLSSHGSLDYMPLNFNSGLYSINHNYLYYFSCKKQWIIFDNPHITTKNILL